MNIAAELGTFGYCPEGRELDWLHGQGVPDRCIYLACPGPIFIATISVNRADAPEEGPLFDFDPGGERAYCHPVWDAAGEIMLDIIAWTLGDPTRWWLRTGLATVLGEGSMCFAYARRIPMPIWRTPLRWWKANGWGIVVLDWQGARIDLLDLLVIEGEDLDHGVEIEKRLRYRVPPLPKIRVPRTAEEAA